MTRRGGVGAAAAFFGALAAALLGSPGCAQDAGPAEPPPSDDRTLILRMLDLGPEGLGGGGDALLLTDSTATGQTHALVDGGPFGETDGELRFGHVSRELSSLGVDTLAFAQVSHAHADHFLGVYALLEELHVEIFVHNGQRRRSDYGLHGALLDRAKEKADSVATLNELWEHRLGSGSGATRTVHVPPLPDYLEEDLGAGGPDDHRKLNEGSIGTVVEVGGVRIFLAADGEDEAHDRWRTEFASLTRDVDILKVGHHGANNAVFDNRTGAGSRSSRWLAHTSPELQLVSANGRSHPRRRALERMEEVDGSRVYCTSTHGNVEVRVAGGEWTVSTERNGDAGCDPGAEAGT